MPIYPNRSFYDLLDKSVITIVDCYIPEFHISLHENQICIINELLKSINGNINSHETSTYSSKGTCPKDDLENASLIISNNDSNLIVSNLSKENNCINRETINCDTDVLKNENSSCVKYDPIFERKSSSESAIFDSLNHSMTIVSHTKETVTQISDKLFMKCQKHYIYIYAVRLDEFSLTFFNSSSKEIDLETNIFECLNYSRSAPSMNQRSKENLKKKKNAADALKLSVHFLTMEIRLIDDLCKTKLNNYMELFLDVDSFNMNRFDSKSQALNNFLSCGINKKADNEKSKCALNSIPHPWYCWSFFFGEAQSHNILHQNDYDMSCFARCNYAIRMRIYIPASVSSTNIDAPICTNNSKCIGSTSSYQLPKDSQDIFDTKVNLKKISSIEVDIAIGTILTHLQSKLISHLHNFLFLSKFSSILSLNSIKKENIDKDKTALGLDFFQKFFQKFDAQRLRHVLFTTHNIIICFCKDSLDHSHCIFLDISNFVLDIQLNVGCQEIYSTEANDSKLNFGHKDFEDLNELSVTDNFNEIIESCHQNIDLVFASSLTVESIKVSSYSDADNFRYLFTSTTMISNFFEQPPPPDYIILELDSFNVLGKFSIRNKSKMTSLSTSFDNIGISVNETILIQIFSITQEIATFFGFTFEFHNTKLFNDGFFMQIKYFSFNLTIDHNKSDSTFFELLFEQFAIKFNTNQVLFIFQNFKQSNGFLLKILASGKAIDLIQLIILDSKKYNRLRNNADDIMKVNLQIPSFQIDTVAIFSSFLFFRRIFDHFLCFEKFIRNFSFIVEKQSEEHSVHNILSSLHCFKNDFNRQIINLYSVISFELKISLNVSNIILDNQMRINTGNWYIRTTNYDFNSKKKQINETIKIECTFTNVRFFYLKSKVVDDIIEPLCIYVIILHKVCLPELANQFFFNTQVSFNFANCIVCQLNLWKLAILELFIQKVIYHVKLLKREIFMQ